MITIRNARTGETRNIDESQLGQYGLGGQSTAPDPKTQYQQAWSQAPDIKTKDAIANSYKNAFGVELFSTKTLSDTDQKKADAQAKAERIITQAENLYFGGAGAKGDLASGRYGSVLQRVLGAVGQNTPLNTYRGFLDTSRPDLVKAAGDVGNFSETEQQKATALFPGVTSTPEEALSKFANIRKRFNLPERDLSPIAAPARSGGVVGLFQQKSQQPQTQGTQVFNALSAGIPALSLYDPQTGELNKAAVDAAGETLATLAGGKLLGIIKNKSIPLLQSTKQAGAAIEAAAKGGQTIENTGGATVSGNKIIASVQKVVDAAPPTEKAALQKILKVTIKQYKNKDIPLEVANQTLNMANDAYTASGAIGSSAKAAAEAATSRAIREQLPAELEAARKTYGAVRGKEQFLRRLFPSLVGTGVSVGAGAILGRLLYGQK